MRAQLKCVCIDCQKEAYVWWRASYKLYICSKCWAIIKSHKSDAWHNKKRGQLHARKYYWQRMGVHRWVKKYSLQDCPRSVFGILFRKPLKTNRILKELLLLSWMTVFQSYKKLLKTKPMPMTQKK